MHIKKKERTDLDKAIAEIQSKIKECDKEIEIRKENDPQLIVQMEKDVKDLITETNNDTDKIFTIFSWIGRKFPGIDKKSMMKEYELGEEMDYV